MPSEFRFEPRSLVLVLGQADTKYAHSGAYLQKHVFEPFVPPKRPIFKAFWDFPRPKTCLDGLKRARNTSLSIPSGLGTASEKLIFSPWRPRSTHRWLPLCAALAAPWLHLVRQFSALETRRKGGCGWTRCPHNFHLSHRTQDTTRFWFGVTLTQAPRILGHWPFFGRFTDILWS